MHAAIFRLIFLAICCNHFSQPRYCHFAGVVLQISLHSLFINAIDRSLLQQDVEIVLKKSTAAFVSSFPLLCCRFSLTLLFEPLFSDRFFALQAPPSSFKALLSISDFVIRRAFFGFDFLRPGVWRGVGKMRLTVFIHPFIDGAFCCDEGQRKRHEG